MNWHQIQEIEHTHKYFSIPLVVGNGKTAKDKDFHFVIIQFSDIDLIHGSGGINNITNGKEKFSCMICGKLFTTKSSLATHMQYHTGRFNHYCDMCRKGFASSSHYKDHMDKQQGIRYCEICTKSFTRRRDYQYHMSVHTGNYKFKCESCGEGFNVKPQYQKHLAKHVPDL